MKYITTKEAAERWKISPRRVALLASQGRIEGAIPPDSGWLIPENACKPEDKRKKEAKSATVGEDDYVFPFLLACVNDSKRPEQFTPEEQKLYELCLVYESGDFESARTLAEAMLSSENRYIRIGALYHLPIICMYLLDFKSSERYTLLFRSVIHMEDPHSAELMLLLDALDSELVSVSEFTQSRDTLPLHAYPDELLPSLSFRTLFSELIRLSPGKKIPDVACYEINCRFLEAQGYFYYAMLTHSCLSAYYSAVGNSDDSLRHTKRAIEIGLEHDTLFTLSYFMAADIDSAMSVLQDYPPEVAERFLKLSQIFFNGRTLYAEYRDRSTLLADLAEGDYQLILCCMKEYSIEQMAERFGLSKSGMNRRLSRLYKRLGVKSKHELVKKYLGAFLNWGREWES